MERAARELGLDPVEVRRRNVITEFPYTGVNGVTYDPGTYLESLDLAEATIRDEGWYEAREEADRKGDRHLGIGFCCFSERTGYGSEAFAKRKMTVVPGFDLSEIRMDTTGSVVVTSGTMNHGQSHETTFAQIVADRLGLDVGARQAAPGRHRAHRLRLGHVRLALGDDRRLRGGAGLGAARRAAVPDRRAPAGDPPGQRRAGRGRRGGAARRPGAPAAVRGHRRRRPPALAPAAQGRRARAHRDGELRRPRRRDLLQRLPRRRRRGRPGHRGRCRSCATSAWRTAGS